MMDKAYRETSRSSIKVVGASKEAGKRGRREE
jgi:hypothetical protein